MGAISKVKGGDWQQTSTWNTLEKSTKSSRLAMKKKHHQSPITLGEVFAWIFVVI